MNLTRARGELAVPVGRGQVGTGAFGSREEPVGFLWPAKEGVPVAYTSAASGVGVKERLVAILMDRLPGCASGERKRGPATEAVLERNGWGRPLMGLGEIPVPVVSFSHCEGKTWAALGRARGVGIDAAAPGEFAGNYPFFRAFRQRELSAVAAFSQGPADAAALLWSIKEASVKALGCGFHLVDPLEVEVGEPAWDNELLRFSVNANAVLHAVSLREGNVWLTTSVLA